MREEGKNDSRRKERNQKGTRWGENWEIRIWILLLLWSQVAYREGSSIYRVVIQKRELAGAEICEVSVRR